MHGLIVPVFYDNDNFLFFVYCVIVGVSTIKAFKKEEMFAEKLHRKINHANKASMASIACDR